jgi:uncharacterized membrane protein YkoI
MRILLFLALAVNAALAAAASHSDPDPTAFRVASGAITMDQAVKMAEQRFKARVVRAEAQQDNGRTIYVLRMLADSGRVWTVRVDASSGSLM